MIQQQQQQQQTNKSMGFDLKTSNPFENDFFRRERESAVQEDVKNGGFHVKVRYVNNFTTVSIKVCVAV